MRTHADGGTAPWIAGCEFARNNGQMQRYRRLYQPPSKAEQATIDESSTASAQLKR